MPGTPRKPRTSPGPGRQQQRRRPRAGARPAAPKAKPAIPVPRWQRRLKLTRRALALGVVVLALAVSFISTFQIYVRQQHEMAVADQQIRDSTAQIATLETELARWNDPAYVRAQARERLGWAMPGETGFRLVDDNGNPIGGGVTLESAQRPVAGEDDLTWWQRLNGSLATADSPVRRIAGR
jgi:cell division protein FtsB